MNKNEYKDYYLDVLRAIKQIEPLREHGTPISTTVPLYLDSKSGISHIPFYVLKDILDSMEAEGLIKIAHYPRMSVLLSQDKPTTFSDLPPFLRSRSDKRVENYYSIEIYLPFRLVYAHYCLPVSLLSNFKENKKNRVQRSILKLLLKEGTVEIYKVLLLINKLTKGPVLSTTDFKRGYIDYLQQVKNRIKALDSNLKNHGYKIKIKNDYVSLVLIQS